MLRFLIPTVLLALLAAPVSWAQDHPWLTPLLDSTSTLAPGEVGRARTHLVPVSTAAPAAELTVTPAAVRRAGYSDPPGNIFALEPGLVPDGGRGTFLKFTVASTLPLSEGTYDVSVRVQRKGVKEPQFLALKLVQPAAVLLAPASLSVKQDVWPWGQAMGMAPHVLLLEETGRKAHLNGIILNFRSLTHPQEEVKGGLAVKNKAALDALDVAPGKAAPVEFEASGPFPLGVSSGNAVVRAATLPDVTIPVQVTTRVTPVVMLLVMVLGLVLGGLARTLLQQRRALAEAREKGFEQLDLIDREIERREDTTLRRQVETAYRELQTAVQGDSVEAIAAKVTSAASVLADALKELRARRADLEGKLLEARRVLHTRWLLPPDLAARFQAYDVQLNGVTALLEAENVTGAQVELERVGGDPTLLAGIRSWRSQVRDGMASLADGAVHLPADVEAPLKEALGKIRTSLDSALGPDGPVRIDLADLLGVLKAIHTARGSLADLFADLRRWLAAVTQDCLNDLRAVSLPDPSSVKELEQEQERLEGSLSGAAADPEASLAVLDPVRLGRLGSAWRGAFLGQKGQISDERWKAIRKQIDDRQFREAARAIADATLEALQGMAMGGEAAAVAATPLRAWSPTPLKAEPAGILLMPGVATNLLPARVHVSRSQNFMELLLARGWLWAIAVVLLVLLGYVLYEPKWVGTPQDVAFVFFWAFALDVTVDSVIKTASGLKAPGA